MAGTEEEESPDDKPYEASQKRLDDARRKGEVPHSADLTGAAAYGGLVIAAFFLGTATLRDFGAVLSGFLTGAEAMSALWFSGPAPAATGGVLLAVVLPLAPWFGLPMAAALLAVIAQQAFVISGEKLIPKLQRISPISGAKNKFGRNGLFEFVKSTVKLVVISVILFSFLASRLPQMMTTLALEAGQATAVMLKFAGEFLIIVFVILAVLGGIDFFWQRAEHLRKHRMSRREMTDEAKESDGDPWMKSKRRDRAMEIATNRMISEVPGADVVIVNPTHYAVALRWDRGQGGAPVCVAKGVDTVAARIREVAMASGVPVRSDPPTARALYGATALGEEIAREHYRAVAVAIRFADRVRRRGREARP